ncbi:hypothetical protein KBZ20_02770 [Vulcanococcus limneticus Candia 3F8]|uniref:hypothetical protein n=1 Tax=Vulcanococcus limneticus TaxID=2170428 RepID=UPI000B987B59|nr:hypothetical protein [Vulcanococcus limneticus]MCP9790621.1 hypothetical protein [Vulcanococcus limneticus MW73D5]MCP9892700.1 hypothetical protein [Vulcanococcus limneticus Candia 3F8]MCP9896228.1 hypothetical protein [Vulcanococcus limneticus Candia 3B3]
MRRILTLAALVLVAVAFSRGWLQLSSRGLHVDGARFSADTGVPLEGSDADKSDLLFRGLRGKP